MIDKTWGEMVSPVIPGGDLGCISVGTLLRSRQSRAMKTRLSLPDCTNRSYLGRKRRYISQGRQKIVGFMEEVYPSTSLAIGNRQKDARLALGAQSDVCLKPRTSPGLLHQRGWAIRISELNPSHPNAGRVSCMAQTLNRLQLCRLQIDGNRRATLISSSWNPQQILKHPSHVCGS